MLIRHQSWGTRCHGWLKHCATSQKVAGLIPDGVIGIFYWYNPSSCTMALGLTQPLTEMNTRNIYWGYRQPVCRADNLTTFMCQMSWNLGAPTSWNPQSRPVMGLPFNINHLNLSFWSPCLPFQQNPLVHSGALYKIFVQETFKNRKLNNARNSSTCFLFLMYDEKLFT